MESLDFSELFEKMVKDAGKLFVPENLDNRLAANLITFAEDRDESSTILVECVKRYLGDVSKMVITLRDFANNIENIFQEIHLDHESKREFDIILRQTAERMKNKNAL